MQQVALYFSNNPGATVDDAIQYFADYFEIGKQIDRLKREGSEVHRIRELLRPLYGQKRDLDDRLKFTNSDIESAVYEKYPSRTGNDALREKERNELRSKNPEYQRLTHEFKEVSDKVLTLEWELDEIERDVKNARRLSEIYPSYMDYCREYKRNLPNF